MANLLFYNKPVALNKTTHKDIKIRTGSNSYCFASNTNSVILAGVEFSEAAKEYPVVFAQANDSFVPVALLGLRNEENLFVDQDGRWDSRYIPAFIRRYPFVLAGSEDPKKRMVCIDESFDGFNDKEGEPLFLNDEPTPVLKQALEFLEEYQLQYNRTERFIQRLKDNDLLMSLNAKIEMADGNEFALTGLFAVDEKKLLQLADDHALALFKSGELAWVYCHLMSMGNISNLVNRIGKLTGPVAPATNARKKPATKATKAAAKADGAKAKKPAAKKKANK